jgi:hypothetical protein
VIKVFIQMIKLINVSPAIHGAQFALMAHRQIVPNAIRIFSFLILLAPPLVHPPFILYLLILLARLATIPAPPATPLTALIARQDSSFIMVFVLKHAHLIFMLTPLQEPARSVLQLVLTADLP